MKLETNLEQDSLLLAYYFGNIGILNSTDCSTSRRCGRTGLVADDLEWPKLGFGLLLQIITRDLINNFQAAPQNDSTKYSSHVEGCCICHERKELFKKILKQHHESGSKSNAEGNHPDQEECWNQLKEFWSENGIWSDSSGPDAHVVDQKQLGERAIALLSSHKVSLSECRKKWDSLQSTIKAALTGCLASIARINKGKLDVTPLPSQCPRLSRARLRNAYLTLMISKGARTQAKHVQGCREVGLQIRAARDPVSVVCKYMMCANCFEKSKSGKVVNVADILRRCFNDLPSAISTPSTDGRLRSDQAKPAAVVAVQNSARAAETLKLNRARNQKPERVFFLRNHPSVAIVQSSSNRLKRKLPAAGEVSKKIRLTSTEPDRQSLNVVIVGNNNSQGDLSAGTSFLPSTSEPVVVKPLKASGAPVASTNDASFIPTPANKLNCHPIWPRFTPVTVAAGGAHALNQQFVVQIINGGQKNASADGRSIPASTQAVKTIPFGNGAIKLVKAVSLKSQNSPKTPGSIFVQGLKFSNSVVAPLRNPNFNGLNPIKVTESGKLLNFSSVSKQSVSPRFFSFSNCAETASANPSQANLARKAALLKNGSKTPSKKRAKPSFPSKPVSTVVAEYLLSLMPGADKALWRNLNSRRKRRWEKSSSMIPVPYETHFLCIDSTIEKQGWKAYWYRKCRCSKIREKTAGQDGDAEASGYGQEDVKNWIPASITETMRTEFASSFEREDNYSSPSASSSGKPREVFAGANDASTPKKGTAETSQLDLSRVKLEFEYVNDNVPDTSAKPSEAENHVASNSEGARASTHANIPTPVTLKAKYCRGKNGLWQAMDKNPDGQRDKPPNARSGDSCFTVKLNLGSACVGMPDLTRASAKIAYGSVGSAGPRRCPRATMVRRKALVDRAVTSERNTKAKRVKSESRAADNFVFSSTRDASSAVRAFSVITAHPVVFKEDRHLQALVGSRANGKAGIKQRVLTKRPDLDDGNRRKENHYENILSCIMQNASGAKRSEKIDARQSVISDAQRGKVDSQIKAGRLVGELEIAWEKPELEPGAGSRAAKRVRKSRYSYARRRVCVGRINPIVLRENLQLLRQQSLSDPPSSLISAGSAEFVASALRIRPGAKGVRLRKPDAPESRKGYEAAKTRDEGCKRSLVQAGSESPAESDLLRNSDKEPACAGLRCNFVAQPTSKRVRKPRLPRAENGFPSASAIYRKLLRRSEKRKVYRDVSNRATRELKALLKRDHALSCLLASGGVGRPASAERVSDCVAAQVGEVAEADSAFFAPEISQDKLSALDQTVNKRKRLVSSAEGAQGLANDVRKLLMDAQAQSTENHNGCNFNSERPLTSLLSRHLDVPSLQRGIWQSTVAKPIGLRRFRGTIKSRPAVRKAYRGRPVETETAHAVKDPVKTLPSPADTIENPPPVQNCPVSVTCRNLMLIKHNSSSSRDGRTRRPQGITKARMQRWSGGRASGVDDLAVSADCASGDFRVNPEGSGKGDSKTAPRVQTLRERVFAELRNTKSFESGERKLNRCSTDGVFISGLLRLDAERASDAS